eukprot:gene9364-biopygen7970
MCNSRIIIGATINRCQQCEFAVCLICSNARSRCDNEHALVTTEVGKQYTSHRGTPTPQCNTQPLAKRRAGAERQPAADEFTSHPLLLSSPPTSAHRLSPAQSGSFTTARAPSTSVDRCAAGVDGAVEAAAESTRLVNVVRLWELHAARVYPRKILEGGGNYGPD